MRLGLGSGSGEMFDLFAQAGENAARIALAGRGAIPGLPGQPDLPGRHQGARARRATGSSPSLLRSVDAQLVTPYDRQDIVALAYAVDEVPDKIENASELLGLYGDRRRRHASRSSCAACSSARRPSCRASWAG